METDIQTASAARSSAVDEDQSSEEQQRIQGLESQENALIQHIRTAGLRKEREHSLVNDVMELRKQRRQMIVAYQHRQSAWQAQVSMQFFAHKKPRCLGRLK